ncbi:MAG: TatD family hydrolase [Bacteriovoracaceae bacterium]|nr:TatD family hydrolase [Bacteriovoracaceae bacterium]
MTLTYVDIHTHHKYSQRKDVESIINSDYFLSGKTPEQNHTVGLHPWWIEKVDVTWKTQLTQLLSKPYCLGLGEIGLDYFIEFDRKIQAEVCLTQLEMAKKFKILRIVFHCVRAYSDLYKLIKESGYSGKCLLHDFNGNEHELKQFLKLDCYFGFGAKLFKMESKTRNLINLVPLERMFLETDEQDNITIEQIYHEASQLRKIEPNVFATSLLENYQIFTR